MSAIAGRCWVLFPIPGGRGQNLTVHGSRYQGFQLVKKKRKGASDVGGEALWKFDSGRNNGKDIAKSGEVIKVFWIWHFGMLTASINEARSQNILVHNWFFYSWKKRQKHLESSRNIHRISTSLEVEKWKENKMRVLFILKIDLTR